MAADLHHIIAAYAKASMALEKLVEDHNAAIAPIIAGLNILQAAAEKLLPDEEVKIETSAGKVTKKILESVTVESWERFVEGLVRTAIARAVATHASDAAPEDTLHDRIAKEVVVESALITRAVKKLECYAYRERCGELPKGLGLFRRFDVKIVLKKEREYL